jgi:hypothetical protein
MFPTDRAALETALARVLDVAVEFATLGEYRFAPLPDAAHGTASASDGPDPVKRRGSSSVGVTSDRLPAPATALGRIRAAEAAAEPVQSPCPAEGRGSSARPPRQPRVRARHGMPKTQPQVCLTAEARRQAVS